LELLDGNIAGLIVLISLLVIVRHNILVCHPGRSSRTRAGIQFVALFWIPDIFWLMIILSKKFRDGHQPMNRRATFVDS
jgi:hypothetical protein